MLQDNEICCISMKNRVISTKDLKVINKDRHVVYLENCRSYHWASIDGHFDILCYCPWCGAKLPEVLDPDYTICAEYGQDYVRYSFEPEYKELPPEIKKEFETDEWWKKRNIGPDDTGF